MSRTVVDVIVSGTTATVVDARVDGVTTVAGAAPVTNVTGQIPDIGVVTNYITENITLTSDGFNTLSGGLVATGQYLTDEITIVSGLTTGSASDPALSGKVDTLSGNLISTGQYLTDEITIVSGLTTGSSSDPALSGKVDTLSGNLITTGQYLTDEIAIVSGLAGGQDFDTLSGNLITTGQTLTTNINTVSSNLVSTGSVVDDISGNLIATGQTLESSKFDKAGGTLVGSVFPNLTESLDLGSSGQKWRNLWVKDAHVNSGTLFLGEDGANIKVIDNRIQLEGDSVTKGPQFKGDVLITDGTLSIGGNLAVTANQTGVLATAANLITTGRNLDAQIASNDSDISTLTTNLISTGAVIDSVSGNLISTGNLLNSEIAIVSGIATGGSAEDFRELSGNLIATGKVVDDVSGNLITTGQTLQTQITSNDGDITTLTSNLITTGQTLTSEIAIVSGIATGGSAEDFTALSGDLITTGQTLQTQITSNDSDISALTSNLVTTGQTLTTDINTVSTNLISTGAIVDDISGNLITTGQTLQTQITSNDGDITTLTSNLITTGQTLTSEIGTVSGLITDNDAEITALLAATGELKTDTNTNASNLVTTGQTLQTQITSNDGDISTLTSNLVTTGQTLTTNINTVSSNLVSTGSVVDDISGNLITTGQTLQTQITSNDGDITNLTTNLITTGQTLTTEINTVSGLITDNDDDITALKAATGVLKTSTDNNTANLISTGSIVDDISGNLITTGQTLQTQITSNDSDISTLTSNLVTTGQTLTTNINTVSSSLVSTGSVVDDISGNLITTGQTLQTQITSNDGDISTLTTNLGTTGQTLQTQITSNDADIATLDSTTVKLTTNQSVAGNKIFTDTVTINNLTVTGTEVIVDVENLAVKDNIIHINSGESGAGISRISGGITIDRGTEPAANILYNDANDRFELNFPLATEGNLVASAANLITTGQTLQTQITSNDGDITTLTTNLGTTGQTLQTQITSNDSDISTLTSNLSTTNSNLVTTGQTLTTNINTVSTNLVSTGSIVDDISGNLITTGQTLQTQITSNDTDITNLSSNLVATGQTLTTNINTVATNLVSTGQTLTSEIATVSGLIPATVIDGGGTANTVPRWTDTDTIGDSIITVPSNTSVQMAGELTLNYASPILNIGKLNTSTGNAKLRFNSKNGTAANAFDIQFVKTATEDRLDFLAGGATTRVSFLNDGNVGIGTNAPNEALEVNGLIRIFDSAANKGNISALNTSDQGVPMEIRAEYIALRPSASSPSTSHPEAMRIATGGKVGIGTTNPGTDLEVYKSSGLTQLYVNSGSIIARLAVLASNQVVVGSNSNADFWIQRNGVTKITVASSAITLADDTTVTGGVVATSTIQVSRSSASPLFQVTDADAGGGAKSRWFGLVDGTSRFAIYGTNGSTEEFNLADGGAATFTGAVTANAGINIDNININGTTIALSSGNLTLDVAGHIDIDAGDGNIYLSDDGTTYGQLANSSTNFVVKSYISDKDILFQGVDGGSAITALTLDMSDAGTAIFNHDITLPDNGRAVFGGGSDLQVYHDGSNSYIKDAGVGDLKLLSSGLAIQSANGNEYLAYFAGTGGQTVSLYAGNSKKFETTSTGVAITGHASMTTGSASGKFAVMSASVHGSYDFYNNGTTYLNGSTIIDDALSLTGANAKLQLPDNGKANFGAGDDLQIWHDGNNSYIRDAGTGVLYIEASADLILKATDSNELLRCNANSSVQLYHNGSEKLETTSTGVTVTGALTAAGSAGNISTNASGDSWLCDRGSAFAMGSSHASGSIAFWAGNANKLNLSSAGHLYPQGNGTKDLGLSGNKWKQVYTSVLKTTTILDTNDSAGTSGQILTSTGSALDWKTLGEISGVDGSGTAGYLSKWTDSDTIGNSPIYTDGTDVAIGSTAFGVGGTQDLSIGNPGTTTGGITLWSTTSATHSLGFGDANSGTARYEGYVEYSHGDNSMRLATSHAERVRIISDGKVGIGTAAPVAQLMVSEAIPPGTQIGGSNTLKLAAASSNAVGRRMEIGFDQFYGSTYSHSVIGQIVTSRTSFETGDLYFATKDGTTNVAPTERMRITSAGKVGIGTTSPNEKLHVYDGNFLVEDVNPYIKLTEQSDNGYFVKLQSFHNSGDTFKLSGLKGDFLQHIRTDDANQNTHTLRLGGAIQRVDIWGNSVQRLLIDETGKVGNISG